MIIFSKSEFLKCAYNFEDFPHHFKPEIAISGKSNVGKSSLINTLLKKKKIAKISSTPGKTQSINFFKINDSFYLVDLPGYGYAKVPEKVKKHWAELIENYLHNRRNLKGIIQLVDARHPPTSDDKMMVEWLNAQQIPKIIVATKIDKISKGKRQKQKQAIIDSLNLENDIVFFSAKTGEGRNEIIDFISELI